MPYLVAIAVFALLVLLILRERSQVGISNATQLIGAFASLVPLGFLKGNITNRPAEETAVLVAAAHALCILVTGGRPGLLVYAMDTSLDREKLKRLELAIVKAAPWALIALAMAVVLALVA